MNSRSTLFREIHKNTWLKRLTADGKKVTIGPKKSDRSWVVFCVHDDSEAILEGYTEPRFSASHNPEWVLSLQGTQHISHALVPNEHDYEFVVTLHNEVVRFHAMSWEIMQEWVDTLRSKLREMKILSPRENFYTKLPEFRVPLLPTRDPTSPLPATPPVPAAIVPGVECIVPSLSTSSESTNAGIGPRQISLNQSDLESETAQSLNSNNINRVSNNSSPVPTSNNCVSLASTSNLSSISNNIAQNLNNSSSDLIFQPENIINDVEENQSNSSDDLLIPGTSVKLLSELCHSSSKVLNIGTSLHDERNIQGISFVKNGIIEGTDERSNRNTCTVSNLIADNSIRVDVNASVKSNIISRNKPRGCSQDDKTDHELKVCRSLSFTDTFKDDVMSNNNVTELDIQDNSSDHEIEPTTNITIIQVSNPLPSSNKGPDIFQFPENSSKISCKRDDYKSNVQIIPSNLNKIPINIAEANEYAFSNKVRKHSVNAIQLDNDKITKVHVSGSLIPNSYGTVFPNSYGTVFPSSSETPNGHKKIILSTNSSGVTNIAVNNQIQNQNPAHYEKIFLSSSSPILVTTNNSRAQTNNSREINIPSLQNPCEKNLNTSSDERNVPSNNSNDGQSLLMDTRLKNVSLNHEEAQTTSPLPSRSTATTNIAPSQPVNCNRKIASPALQRRRLLQSNVSHENQSTPYINRPVLTRGLTEAVITKRPSRIDLKKSKENDVQTNNNVELHNSVDRTRSESLELRRRSSSTSDAPPLRPRTNNNEIRPRMQQPPVPFRMAHEIVVNQSSKLLTLREHQVLQLRREIVHPGGVKLQLRRKDCLGSIAWIEAFGSVWVAGWKQKEYPVLYNALHIGDQLISISGITISSPAEANKIIRNANTLFVEILIRRMPFGRVYAIRREREGQCLGLIRDGNTSTIVDVVPNSLAARHGLPPKTKSCDGTTLTFWVLTEINGRPLNVFFKDNEIRDRLNSVGRDISILVQPSDLMVKIKKQLKSLRSYKDYIVQ